MEKSEQPSIPEQEEIFNRSVVVWMLRHFKPSPSYEEEKPLTKEAPKEAKEAAAMILDQIPDGEMVIIYGAGPRGRHQKSMQLLKGALETKIREDNRKIELIDLPPTADIRKSLREAGFNSKYGQKAGGYGEVLPYWMKSANTMEGKVEPPEKIFKRFRTLLRGLFKFTGRQKPGSKVNWLLITSGEVPTPEMVKKFGKEGLGLRPGRWVKFEVEKGGSLEQVKMTHWSGLSATTDLSKT